MRIRVKVFATLRSYLPPEQAKGPFELELREGAAVADLLEQLALPPEQVKIVFVNGRLQPGSYALGAGDDVGIFPPIAGG